MEIKAIILLVALNLCHWACDYTHLSTPKMLQSKRNGTGLEYIFMHATFHGWTMAFVIFWFINNPTMWVMLCFFEIGTHFVIDLLKGKLNAWFPKISSPNNPFHWYIFGADQFLHQVVIIFITYLACNN